MGRLESPCIFPEFSVYACRCVWQDTVTDTYHVNGSQVHSSAVLSAHTSCRGHPRPPAPEPSHLPKRKLRPHHPPAPPGPCPHPPSPLSHRCLSVTPPGLSLTGISEYLSLCDWAALCNRYFFKVNPSNRPSALVHTEKHISGPRSERDSSRQRLSERRTLAPASPASHTPRRPPLRSPTRPESSGCPKGLDITYKSHRRAPAKRTSHF